MPYSEELAHRVHCALAAHESVTERRMFGGLCVMVRGHMTVGVLGEELMVRVGPDAWPDALKQPHAREMDFTGKTMKGMIYVASEGIVEDDALAAWIERALAFVATLPDK